MRRLLVLVAVLATFAACAAAAQAGCVTGNGWGNYWYPHIPTAGNSFSSNLIVNDYNSTSGGNHTIGRIGFQYAYLKSNTSDGQIQEGIDVENGNPARFYVEVSGPQNVNAPSTGGPWEGRPTGCSPPACSWDHFYGSASKGTTYSFTLKNNGNGYYEAYGPGYDSGSIYTGVIGTHGSTVAPVSTITNEAYYAANDSTCSTWGNYEWFNILPSAYATGFNTQGTNQGWFQSGNPLGANEFFTHSWTNPDGVVYISIDGS